MNEPASDASANRDPGAVQQTEIARLYRQAFAEFGATALWSSRAATRPTVFDALAITESLRVEGDLSARRLAERIEQACRAAV